MLTSLKVGMTVITSAITINFFNFWLVDGTQRARWAGDYDSAEVGSSRVDMFYFYCQLHS